jgi:Signal transduction histidine kinase
MLARIQLATLILLALLAGRVESIAAADWLVDAWRVEEGLPDNIVDAITQTPDGYLWLGTQGGLVRFDGVRFSPIDDPAFKIERVRQLYVDRSGRLWVLGEVGNVALIHEGRVKSFTSADGVPRDGLQTPTEDADGRVWFSASANQGCFCFDGVRFVSMLSTNGPAVGQFQHLAFDSDGTLYGGRLGELWKLYPGVPELVPNGADPQRVPVLCPSRHGGFWLITHNECFLVHAGKWERLNKIPYQLPTLFEVSANYEDAEGRLWFATRFQPKPISVATNGIIADQTFISRSNLNCRVLFEDREGNRWWSTGNDGLRRFRPRQLELVTDGANLPANIIRAVAADPEQGVWVVIGRGIVRVTNSVTREASLLTNRVPYARSLWIDPDGTVWVGQDHIGLYRISTQGFDRFSSQTTDGTSTPLFSALFRDAQSNFLIGSSEGLFRIAGDAIQPVTGNQLEAGRLDFRCFAQDTHGRLYAGLRNAGLRQCDNGQWAHLTNDLPGDDIAALWCDADDALWIGATGHGLCRMKSGKTFSFQQTRVRLPRNICGIIEDELSYLWLASSEGIFRVSRAQLNAVADGQADDAPIRPFDKKEGMISGQCVGGEQSVVARSKDGKLWFATTAGLFVIDPRRLSQNELKPPVIIEEVLVDDRTVWSYPLNSSRAALTPLKIPPDNSRVEVRFTALSLSQPQRNRFRFQLAKLNKDWVEADTERVADYTRVPPGDYQFKVIACNNDGVWNNTGATLAITVLPYFWQTLWFRGLALFTFALLLFGGYRWRIRGLERERALQHEFARGLLESQEQERRRIAAELHDSLGQSLLTVKNYATMALKEPTLPEKTQKQLREISDSASASIEEVRSIARALRPYQLDRFGLTKTLEDTADTVTRAGNLQIKTEIENIDGLFSADAEISIYRIAQESLNNVVKHSRASTARFEVRKDDGLLRMTLEDNGVGFDYDAMINRSSSGFGLVNLRERVRLLGGTLRIDTSPGKGTRLAVDIPRKL